MSRMSLREFFAVREFTGLHMLVVTVTFFLVVIAANVTMAVFAATSWSGLLAKNGYVASIDFARDAADREAAAKLGWEITAEAEDGLVTITARDRAGDPLFRPAVTASASRPVTDAEDRALQFEPLGDGRFRSTAPLPAGAWNVDATVASGEAAIARRFRLEIRRAGR
jgi:nitrogen fixation protein FixH